MENPSASSPAFVGPLVEAQRVWSALRGYGMDAWLLNQQGNLYQLGSVIVAVRTSELERAQALLVELGLLRAPARQE